MEMKKITDLLVSGEDMQNIFLYITATVIWGTTWLGIKLQLTQVPPILSVSYRFCLAFLILIGNHVILTGPQTAA
jgi:drug/metabolite transporter (DMT)-like permease